MRILGIIVFTLIGVVCAAQNTAYTQYFVHKQTDNPAAMGAETHTSAGFLGQYRLYGFENAPMSGAVQVTVPFGGTEGGNSPRSIGSYYSDGIYSRTGSYGADDVGAKPMFAGIAVKASTMGVYQRYEALLSYAYQLHFATSALSLGLSLGAYAESNNYQSLTNDYNIDPLQNSGQNAKWSFATQTGIYWHNDNFYASAYSPAVTKGDAFVQSGYSIAFGGSDAEEYDSPAKKNKWAIHAQAGRLGTGGWQVQGASIFTLKGLLNIGFAWHYPMNFAALAAINIGGIQIGYSYGIYGLNANLLQHEISLKIRFAGKKEMD
jgi:type IX secretion system PorP/SprF family membrane protein